MPLLFGKSYLKKRAKASKIQIKIQTLEPVSTESKSNLLLVVKMQEPMTETIRNNDNEMKSELRSVKSEVCSLKSEDTSRFPYRSHKTKKKPKEKNPNTMCVGHHFRKQTQITLIRHDPS